MEELIKRTQSFNTSSKEIESHGCLEKVWQRDIRKWTMFVPASTKEEYLLLTKLNRLIRNVFVGSKVTMLLKKSFVYTPPLESTSSQKQKRILNSLNVYLNQSKPSLIKVEKINDSLPRLFGEYRTVYEWGRFGLSGMLRAEKLTYFNNLKKITVSGRFIKIEGISGKQVSSIIQLYRHISSYFTIKDDQTKLLIDLLTKVNDPSVNKYEAFMDYVTSDKYRRIHPYWREGNSFNETPIETGHLLAPINREELKKFFLLFQDRYSNDEEDEVNEDDLIHGPFIFTDDNNHLKQKFSAINFKIQN